MADDHSGGFHGAGIGSWLATAVIIAGTIVGGIALIYWNWPMFWVGTGLFVAGSIAGVMTGMMSAVSEYDVSDDARAQHKSLISR